MAAIAILRPDTSYFFQQLSLVERGVLVLDYDSAIARFGPPRRRQFPYPTVYEILDSILSTTRTRVVIVSKRRTRELERVLGVIANPATWHAENLQLITLNDNYHQCTPQSLLANLCAVGPLAYLSDQEWTRQNPAARDELPTAVQPLFFLGHDQTWLGVTEDLIQFLIDWLRACGGEVG